MMVGLVMAEVMAEVMAMVKQKGRPEAGRATEAVMALSEEATGRIRLR